MTETPNFQDLLERDKDVIAKLKKNRDNSKVEPEWLLLAEFGLFFGWQAVQEVRLNHITFAEMHKLLVAARRLESMNRYNRVMDTYAATIAVNDKGKALKQTIKGIKDTFNE